MGHPLLRSLVATLCRDDTAQSVIPSNYNAVIPSRYSAVIPSRDNAVIPTATALSSRQLQHCHPEPLQGCHPDRSGGISQPWQRLRLWALCSGDPSAALRMTGLGAIPSRYNDVILSRYNAVIPTATTLSSRQLQHCHPDRSGGISQPWQRLRLWALCSGDPSAALRMTGLGAITSRYKAVISNACERSSISTLDLPAKPCRSFAINQGPLMDLSFSN